MSNCFLHMYAKFNLHVSMYCHLIFYLSIYLSIYLLIPLIVELASLTREGEGPNAKTVIRVIPGEEVDELIKKYQEMVEAKKREEKEKEKEREATKME